MLMICIIITILLIFADQLIKYWAVTDLKALGTIPIIQDVLHLTYSENRGAAFSILTGRTEVLLIVTVAMLAILFYMVFAKKITHKLAVSSIFLIISGGIGNLIDRVSREGNFVVDYIDFRLINFAIFNLADICIVCGTILLMLYFIFIEGKSENNISEEGHDKND